MNSIFKVYKQRLNGWEYGTGVPYIPLNQQAVTSTLGDLYRQQNICNIKQKSLIFPYNISPRMAYKLHCACCLMWSELTQSADVLKHYLPPVANSFATNDKKWTQQFMAAIERIIMRLCKGYGLSPNCIAEQVISYVIINIAQNIFGDIAFGNTLRKYKHHDNDFAVVQKTAIKDQAIIMVFDENEDISTVSLYALYIINKTLWFKAFDENRKFDHLLESESDGNTAKTN